MRMEDVTEETKRTPGGFFEFKEKDVFNHRLVKAAVGKKLHQGLSWSKMSIENEVLGVCYGPEWIEAQKQGEHMASIKPRQASSAANCRCGKGENFDTVSQMRWVDHL